MKELVFATGNANKLAEISKIIGDGYRLLSLKDIEHTTEIEEPYATLEENALHKAETIFKIHQINCFAEDTGLLIDALNGEPGVFSARYAGKHRSAVDNINKVLQQLNGVSESERKARFKTVIALIIEGKSYEFVGEVEGFINLKPVGTNGFGYDPVFYYPDFGKTFAQITIDEKNKISHRKKATQKLINFLKSILTIYNIN